MRGLLYSYSYSRHIIDIWPPVFKAERRRVCRRSSRGAAALRSLACSRGIISRRPRGETRENNRHALARKSATSNDGLVPFIARMSASGYGIWCRNKIGASVFTDAEMKWMNTAWLIEWVSLMYCSYSVTAGKDIIAADNGVSSSEG